MTSLETELLIIGGGPAGTQAATTAATEGVRVAMIEKDIVGGAAHLWDCIPSKTLAASALRHTSVRNAFKLGLVNDPGQVDIAALGVRIKEITSDINENWVDLLADQGVAIIPGLGEFTGANEVMVTTPAGEQSIAFEKALISTGSAPRVPDWAPVDGKRVLTTRDAYDMEDVPGHMIVIGSGVTGWSSRTSSRQWAPKSASLSPDSRFSLIGTRRSPQSWRMTSSSVACT